MHLKSRHGSIPIDFEIITDKICEHIQYRIATTRGADKQLLHNSIRVAVDMKRMGKCHTLRYIVALLLIKLALFEVFSG